MKRIQSILLSLVMFLGIIGTVPMMDVKTGAQTSGIYTYTVEKGEAIITACQQSQTGDITIPSTLGGYSVTAIEEYAFQDCNGLTSVIIPNGVRSIGRAAFQGCYNLQSITIPSSVTRIDYFAFSNTPWRSDYYFKNQVNFIIVGDQILIGFNLPGDITIPNGVKRIDGGAFYESNVTSVIIPDSVISIGNYAFAGSANLTSIVIPDSVTSIGAFAFENCSGLTSIAIPNGLTRINDRTFFRCISLTSVTIPNSVTSIGAYAFEDCRSLTSVDLPTSVLSIDDYAFSNCTSLPNIIIPDSVQFLGYGVFSDCTGLKSVSVSGDIQINHSVFYNCINIKTLDLRLGQNTIISNQVDYFRDYIEELNIAEGFTEIGYGAIAFFNKLTSVKLPNSLTKIGESAFLYCSNLEEITIPNSVIEIGYNAFAECTSLKSVIIPNSVATIGYGAFSNCTSLSSVTIPDSVTEIGHYVFYGCTSLKEASVQNGTQGISIDIFYGVQLKTLNITHSEKTSILSRCYISAENIRVGEGITSIVDDYYGGIFSSTLQNIYLPSSVVNIEYDVFRNCDSSLTIHGRKGSYAESFADNFGFNFVAEYKENYSIVNNSLYNTTITVYENNNSSQNINGNYTVSRGANVNVNGTNYVTLSDGTVSFPVTANGNVTVSKSGFVPITKSANELKNSNKVYLEKDSGNFPILLAVKIGRYDVLREEFTIDLTSQQSITINAEVLWRGGEYSRLYLAQDTATQDFQGNSLTMVLGSKFDVSKTIYIVAEDTNGNVTKKKLKFKNGGAVPGGLDKFGFSFGKKLVGTIPGDHPFFGGSTIGIEIPVHLLPFNLSIEDNKVYFSVGIEVDKYKYDDKYATSNQTGNAAHVLERKHKYLFDNIKKDWSDVKNGLKSLKNIKSKYNQALKYPQGSFGMTADFTIIGFGEGYIDSNSNFILLDAGIIFNPSVDMEWSGQFALGPVPMYWEAYFKAQIEAAFNLYINKNIKAFTPNTTIEGKITLGGGGGVGINQLASVGGGIQGSVKPSYDVYANNVNRENYFKVTANYGAYFVARLALFEYMKNWDSEDYLWFEYPETVNSINSMGLPNNQLSMYNLDNYKIQSRDYIKNPSEFISSQSEINLFSSEPTNKTYSTLKTNVYPNSSPQLVDLGYGRRLVVWIDDDIERSSVNRTCLMYSYFDGISWTDPQAVHNDGTADFMPQLKNIYGSVYLVWQSANSVLEDDATLEEMSEKLDIFAAEYDVGTNSFINATNISNDNTIDMLSRIGGDYSQVSIVWVKNTGNDIFGRNTNNTIMVSTYNGLSWSSPEALYQNLNSIDDLAVGYHLGTMAVAHTEDMDNDINTVNDKELFLNGDRITDNDVLDSKPRIVNGNVYWYSGGQINYMNVSNFTNIKSVLPEGVVIPNDRFEVLHNYNEDYAIVFEKADGLTSNLYSIIYDKTNNKWSNMVELTDLECQINGFSGFLDDSGIMTFAFNKTYIVDEIGSENPYGSADLAILNVLPTYNLSISDIFFLEDNLVSGNDLEFIFDVTNNGELAVNTVVVEVLDSSGNVISTSFFEESVMPGETKEYSAFYTVPDNFSPRDIKIRISPKNQVDFDLTDNEKTVNLNYIDVAVEDVYYGNSEDGKGLIYANIVNRSFDALHNIEVSLVEGTLDGLVLETKIIESIDSLFAHIICFEQEIYNNKVFYVIVKPVENETMLGNNSNFVIASKAYEFNISFENISYNELNKSISVSILASNLTENNKNSNLFICIYDDKKLVKVINKPLLLEKDKTISVDETITVPDELETFVVKVFLWDSTDNIKPLAILQKELLY